MKEKLKDRFFILSIILVIIAGIFSMQLINLQIIQGQEMVQKSKYKLFREQTIPAERGKIFDANGVPIAINRQGFNVYIVRTGLKSDELNEVLLNLANILEKNGDIYGDNFERFITFNPVELKRPMDAVRKWLSREDTFNCKNAGQFKDANDVFKYLRNDSPFRIASSYSDEEAFKIMKLRYEILINGWRFSKGGTVTLAKDISHESVAQIEEQKHKLKGVCTAVEPVRKYIDGQYVAHILGYIGPITEEKLSKLKEKGYTERDLTGLSGVEEYAEEYLRGKDGSSRVEVDITTGRVVNDPSESEDNDIYYTQAVPGNDVILTIDMKLQKAAIESLERNIERIRTSGGKNNKGDANAGAVVAIDINSGEVLAMASYPTFNPMDFLNAKRDINAQRAISDLWKDPNAPAVNRAIQGTYAPGSTFKMLTAIAALEEGVINKNTIIYDSGTIEIGNRVFYCLEYRNGMGAHGPLNLKKALETSCNIYFHKIGFDTTIDKMNKWARYFGLGEKTGIDMNGEKAGVLASIEYKKNVIKDNWRPADTAQAAIGQLYNSFTPLQLANYIASFANGGKRYKPHIIKKVVDYKGNVVFENKPEYTEIPIKQSTIEAVKEGMVAVTHSIDGTAAKVFKNYPFTVAGKTGTAETGRESLHSSNALFVCYAPAENPKIAVAVVVERGVWGSNAAYIAKDVLDEYFGLNTQINYENDEIQSLEPVITR